METVVVEKSKYHHLLRCEEMLLNQRKKTKEWYLKNKTEMAMKRKETYMNDIQQRRDYHNAKSKEYYQRNKDKIRAKYHNKKSIQDNL